MAIETRERILAAASELFSLHGYFGTSTRDIAKLVGIRQPSMYAHFASKAEIMHVLLELNIGAANRAARLVESFDAAAGAKLHRLITADIAYIQSMSYDLAGSLTRGVLEDEEFEKWTRTYLDLHETRRRMIADGVASGEFRPLDPILAENTIAAVLTSILASRPDGSRTGTDLPGEVADFVLGAMVDRFASVRRFAKEAEALPDPYTQAKEVQ